MRRYYLITAGVLSVGALGWQARENLQAEPAANTAPAAPETVRIRAEGRIVTYPGAEVTVTPEVGGRIVRLAVEEGSLVREGQLLAELDAGEERASLEEARARLDEAGAAARLAETEAARDARLAGAQVISAASLDHAVQERDAARAQKEVARAAVRRLEARLGKSRLAAPIGGTVVSRSVEQGETVEAGTPLLVVADLDRTRIEAEVDEFDAARVRVGAPVTIRAEGYAGSWRGRVEEIPDAVTGRRLKPQDPGRPTDTRVLIVKVALQEKLPLRLGQRVEVEIEEAP